VSAPLAAGLKAFDYDVSPDGKQVVVEAADREGKSRLWVAPLDRHAPPRQIPAVEGRQPMFGPSGEIFFRTSGIVYRVHADGAGLRQAAEQPVLLMGAVSPDGKWVVGWSALPDQTGMAIQAVSLTGEASVTVANNIVWSWAADGTAFVISSGPIAVDRSYIVPLGAGQALPALPPGGFRTEQEIAALPGARRIEALSVPGTPPDVYAFYRGTTQRNLYRIPLQ
jgi:hypothetical protein